MSSSSKPLSCGGGGAGGCPPPGGPPDGRPCGGRWRYPPPSPRDSLSPGPPSICISLAMMSVLQRSMPSLSVYLLLRIAPSMYTCRPFFRYSPAISARRPKYFTRCHSVRSCCSPVCLSFQLSAVAVLIVLFALSDALQRGSRSAERAV